MTLDDFTKAMSEGLRAVEAELARTCNAILASGTVSGYLIDGLTGQPMITGTPAEQLCAALRDLEAPPVEPFERRTAKATRYPGYFGVEPQVVAAIRDLNEVKQQVWQISSAAKKAGLSWRDFRKTYAAAGKRHWHGLHVTREIKLVPGEIRALGFTQTASIKSLQRMSLAEAFQWLRESAAYDVIDLLEQRNYPLDAEARVSRPVAEHFRVNVFHEHTIEQVSGSLPVVVDNAHWDGRVSINFGISASRKQGKRRSDCSLSGDLIPLPFLSDGEMQVIV